MGGGTVINGGALAALGGGLIDGDLLSEGTLIVGGGEALSIAGDATIAGTLDVVLEEGVATGPLTLLTAGGSLDADSVVLDASDAGAYQLLVEGSSLLLVAIPEPGTAFLGCLGASVFLVRSGAGEHNRGQTLGARARHTPPQHAGGMFCLGRRKRWLAGGSETDIDLTGGERIGQCVAGQPRLREGPTDAVSLLAAVLYHSAVDSPGPWFPSKNTEACVLPQQRIVLVTYERSEEMVRIERRGFRMSGPAKPKNCRCCIIRWGLLPALFLACVGPGAPVTLGEEIKSPVPLIFDTDIGNDVDDVLALGMIHALQNRGECELLAVTITKDHPLAAEFTDAVNTFYGRGDIPIGVCRSGVTPDMGKYLAMAESVDGDRQTYPHDLDANGEVQDAVAVLRSVLASADDNSVVIVQVGFSTNLARLLDSRADAVSPLSGAELVNRKVRLLSIMAGYFHLPGEAGPGPGSFHLPSGASPECRGHAEYNIAKDIPPAVKLAEQWPTEIVWSGFEIGKAVCYPYASILNDFSYVPHHPLRDSYLLYCEPGHDRPCWDLTSVLYAVRPDRCGFGISPHGRVGVSEGGYTTFSPEPAGKHRILLLEEDKLGWLKATLTLLASQPPLKQSGH